ncbi:hypothetical protein SCHAM137S_07641 [Streptomyces chartreusis]
MVPAGSWRVPARGMRRPGLQEARSVGVWALRGPSPPGWRGRAGLARGPIRRWWGSEGSSERGLLRRSDLSCGMSRPPTGRPPGRNSRPRGRGVPRRRRRPRRPSPSHRSSRKACRAGPCCPTGAGLYGRPGSCRAAGPAAGVAGTWASVGREGGRGAAEGRRIGPCPDGGPRPGVRTRCSRVGLCSGIGLRSGVGPCSAADAGAAVGADSGARGSQGSGAGTGAGRGVVAGR